MDKITTGKEFGGLADVNISAFGTLVTPAASAVIKSGMISFKGNEIRNISSEFGISKGSLKAVNTTVFDYGKYSALRLDADMEIKDDILAVKSMTLKDKKTALGSLKGSYGLKSTDVDAAGSLRGIVISKTDIGYFRGKNIDGIINADLQVKGRADSPQIELDLKSDRQIKIRGTL